MKKQVLRLFSVILSMSIVFSSFSLASAQTSSQNTATPPEDCFLILNCSSDEEIEEAFAKIDENNRIANEKWQEALAKSQLENSFQMNGATALRSTTPALATAETSVDCGLFNYCFVIGYASYEKADNGSYYTFASINNVTLTNKNSESSVSSLSVDHRAIDRARTLAVNYTFKAGAQKSDKTWEYKVVQLYCEFYAGSDTGNFFTT